MPNAKYIPMDISDERAPTNRQFLAMTLSDLRSINHVMKPPITPKSMGIAYHSLLLDSLYISHIHEKISICMLADGAIVTR